MRRWTIPILLPALLLLAVVSSGCNGSGSSGGGGGGLQISVTPSAVSLTLGGTQSFVATFSGGTTISIATTSGAVRATNVVTITTTSAHGFSTGQTVAVSGVTDTTFNGTFTVASVPSTTTFTYAQTGADSTSGGGHVINSGVNWFVNDVQGGSATLGTISTAGLYTAPATLPPPTTVTITATGAARTSNVVTITTTAAHNLLVGQPITISGVTDTSFNGTFSVASAPSTTTFTYSQSGVNATSGGGTVSSFLLRIKAVSVATSTVSGEAVVVIDSGISISLAPTSATIGTSETLQFTATITGSANTSVNWLVNDIAGGNTTLGTVSATGLYTAPASAPSPSSVTVKAVSVADPTRNSTATISIVTAAAPTLTSISPTTAAQGAFYQDLYLTGTNFLSTSTVRVNGTAAQASLVSSTLLRARLSPAQLSTAGAISVDIVPQNGAATPALSLNIVAVRPALVGPSPDSIAQGTGTGTVRFNGGYFGSNSAPIVTAEFNGQLRSSAVDVAESRRLDVTLSGADFSQAGLFPITVRNSLAVPPVASANLAVQPTSSPSVVTTVAVGTSPSAVAVNPATGIAVVVNRGSDNISLLDLATNTVTNTIAVGTSPTGVAIDHLLNLAYVVNNGSNNISVVDLSTASVTATITGFTNAPVSIGINPLTRQGIASLGATNAAALLDLTTNRIVSAASVSTGASAQATVESRLNWGILSPGGAGVVAIVDLASRTSFGIAATGAVRSNNVVTITTSAAHGLVVGQAVFVDGVTDASFHGIFTIASVPSTTTFTYAQSAANANSGNGTVATTIAMATANLGSGLRGVSLNTETEQAFLVDPASPNGVIFSLFDQTVTSVPMEAGHFATAVNPFTNIGVSVNPATDEISVVDLRQPSRLSRLTVGTDPRSVTIDPGANVAVVANEGSNNVSIVNLGTIRLLHVLQVTPDSTLSSGSPLTITVIGSGFSGSSVVRLDETPVTTTFVSSRVLSATIPAAMLATARRFALDVENTGPIHSNVAEFVVVQPVTVGTAPKAVAIDAERDVALVANSGSNNVSVVDMNAGTVAATLAVGTAPSGVAVLPRAGRAVITNSGSNNASILDTAANSVLFTVTVGTTPLGVAINPDTGDAVVANSLGNTLSVFSSISAATPNVSVINADQRPVAVAIDPTRNQALVLHATSNNAAVVALGISSPAIVSRVSNIQLPTGTVYDPVNDRYIVAVSLSNNLVIINPAASQTTSLRVGINPTSIAYNFNSATLVTTNTASRTMTVMDYIDRRVRAVLPVSSTSQFAIEIHPRTNIAVIADETNNRVLLYPLPR